MTETRQMQVRVSFTVSRQADDDLDAMFDRSEGKASTGEVLLANNYRKVQEHQIEIKSDLLNDIM